MQRRSLRRRKQQIEASKVTHRVIEQAAKRKVNFDISMLRIRFAKPTSRDPELGAGDTLVKT
jgi:hypothetical protein